MTASEAACQTTLFAMPSQVPCTESGFDQAPGNSQVGEAHKLG